MPTPKKTAGRQTNDTNPSGKDDKTQTDPATPAVVDAGTGSSSEPVAVVGDAAAALKTDPAPDSPGAAPLAGAALADALVADHAATYAGFDAAIHAVDGAGKPIPKVGGGWQKIRGAKKAGTTAGVLHTTAPTGPAVGIHKPSVKVDNEQAAKVMLNMIISALVIVFGEQWIPANEGEKKGMVLAVKNYFDAKGATTVSPGMALFIAVAAYSMPRLAHEKTISQLDKIKAGFSRFGVWLSAKVGR